jgi:hypothetical protein
MLEIFCFASLENWEKSSESLLGNRSCEIFGSAPVYIYPYLLMRLTVEPVRMAREYNKTKNIFHNSMFKIKYLPWFVGVGIALGLIAVIPAFAATTPTTGPGGWGGRGGAMMGARVAPGVVGTVSAVSGNTLTVTQKLRPNATTTPIVYSVDATNAKVMKNGTSSTVSAIATGDTVMVQGTVTGTTVVATVIRDGVMGGRSGSGGFGKGMGRSSSTPPVSPIQGNGEPVVGGNVTAISGTMITVTNASNVPYTIDASNAKIVKNGTTTTLSAVTTGDSVVAQGTVNGTAVVASSVIDQGSSTAPRAPPSETSGSGSNSGFFGAIGNFFKHIFGF